MIRAVFIQLGITAAGYLYLLTTSTRPANAFAAGGFVIAANFLALAILWSLIFKKKLIALSASLIVFKYAILGLIIYQLITVYAIDLFWFAMGIASFILSALVYTLWTGLTRP